eukprot:scaffold483322_cov20-Prasinocladus_malaysianus.AAC.1
MGTVFIPTNAAMQSAFDQAGIDTAGNELSEDQRNTLREMVQRHITHPDDASGAKFIISFEPINQC